MFAALAAALVIGAIMCTALGSVSIAPGRIAEALLGGGSEQERNILLQIRLPRMCMAVLLGGALAVSGYLLQTFFENPIAGPYVLGISSGASLGAAIAILLGLEAYLLGIGACALVTGLLTIVVIYRIASIGNRMHTTTLLLTGVCIRFYTGKVQKPLDKLLKQ